MEDRFYNELFELVSNMERNKSLTKEDKRSGGEARIRADCRVLAYVFECVCVCVCVFGSADCSRSCC